MPLRGNCARGSGVSAQSKSTARPNSNGIANASSDSDGVGISYDSDQLADNNEEDQENIYFIVRANLDKQELKEMQESIAEEGITVEIKNLEFNAGGLITRIKIEMKSDRGLNGNVYTDNDGQPIEGPVGFYVIYRGEKQHFGTINGDPAKDLQGVRSRYARIFGEISAGNIRLVPGRVLDAKEVKVKLPDGTERVERDIIYQTKDFKTYPKWMYNCKEAKVLEHKNKYETIGLLSIDS